jgi:LEA14-like dessication related protein
MKQLKTILGFVAIGGIAYWLYSRKRLQETALFSFEGVRIANNELQVKLGLANPTNASITINSIVGVLNSKGNDIANVSTFDKIKILPNNKTFINLTVKPSLLGLFTTVKQIVKKGGLKNLSLKFKGTANVNGVALPIDINYTA